MFSAFVSSPPETRARAQGGVVTLYGGKWRDWVKHTFSQSWHDKGQLKPPRNERHMKVGQAYVTH